MSLTKEDLGLGSKKHTVLIIDDNPVNLSVLSNYLREYDFTILVARNGDVGFRRANDMLPDIILLDVMMPGTDGFETCKRLKANESTHDIPVIFLTALARTEDKIKGFEIGAVDYITKPLRHEEVLARLTTHLRLRDLTQKLQSANNVLIKQAIQLKTSSQLAQKVTSILDLNKLLSAVVALILDEFEYYFVGIWLLNKEKNAIMLHAYTGQEDVPPIKPNYQLDTQAEQGIIAWVCQNKASYLARDVQNDGIYEAVPALPKTRSELALPLPVGEEVIGVLDIESEQADAFDEEDVVILETLANQIAVAIRNAQLYESERKLRQLEEERATELAQLNASKDKFFSILSHDLRGPFNSLMGNSQLMLTGDDWLSEADKQEIAEAIHNSAKTTYDLLENLLTWSRLQLDHAHYTPEEIDVHMLADLTVGLLSEIAMRKGVELVNKVDAGKTVYADRNMLDTVIRNLASNAIKFTPEGGKVTIDMHIPYPVGREKWVEIYVRDTGIGMSQADVDKLFKIDVHHTTLGTDKESGTGLGLILCKEMVEKNGGKISVESKLGKGTVVCFTVPAR